MLFVVYLFKWRAKSDFRLVARCMRGCVCVCMCMKAAPREEYPNFGLDAYSVIFCLCLCARMYRRRSLVSALEMESKGLSK